MTTVVEFYISESERKKAKKALESHFDRKSVIKMETGVYDFTQQYCESNGTDLIMAPVIYKDTVSNILFNCEQNCPTMQEIKKGITKQTYNPYNLAFLRPDELDKDNWVKIIMRKNTTEDRLTNLPTIEWKPCRACKNTKHFYYQLQTRSADEPITTFYRCKQCQHVTKINN